MLPKIEKDGLLSAWEPDYFCFQILSVDRDKSNCGGVGGGVIRNAYSCLQGEGVSHRICTYAIILFFHVLVSMVVLCCFVLFVEILSYLHSSKMCSSETIIFLQQDQCICH